MDAVTETKRSNLEEFLREFDRRWLKPRTLSENLSAAIDYLRAPPSLADVLPGAVAREVHGIVDRVDHVGFCFDDSPPDYVERVLTVAGFPMHDWWPSCFSSRRRIVIGHRAVGAGSVEIALDSQHQDPPHVAWRLSNKAALLDIGSMLEGTKFAPPDHMKNRIAFNREQAVMFRYFEGEVNGHRVRLEFCL